MNIDKNIKIAAELDDLLTKTDSIVINSLNQGFALLANAPDPQKVLDSFGDKAVILFSRYEGYRQLLVQMGVDSVPAPSGNFLPNSDGTVKYTAPEPEPELERAPESPESPESPE